MGKRYRAELAKGKTKLERRLLKAKEYDKEVAVEVASVEKFMKNSGKYFEAEISCYATIHFIRRTNEECKVTFYILSKAQCLEVWSTFKILSFTGQILDFKNANKNLSNEILLTFYP